MKLLKKLDLKSIAIIVLIAIIVMMRACQPAKPTVPSSTVNVGGKPYTEVSHTIDTQYVPVVKKLYKKGKDIYHDTIIYVNVPIGSDTAAILKDYFAKKIYIDTLKLDDNLGYIVVNDTVYQNSILGRFWLASVNKIKITDQLVVKELPRNQLYLGLTTGFDRANFINYLGPTMMLKTKTDKVYSVGIGYSATKTVSIQGSVYWKIKLRK